MLRKTIVTLACSSALIVPTLASAEVKADQFNVSPFIGGYTFEGDQNLQTRPVYGLRLGSNITDNWGMEALFSYVATEERRGGGKQDADAYRYGLDALYHFNPSSSLVPYLAAGIGGQHIDYRSSTPNTSGFVANWGGGVKYFLTKALALRGDVRHIFNFEGNEGNLEYTAGVYYAWDRFAPAPAPVPPPAPKPEPKKEVAPPPAPLDSDGDGVYDDKDKCPGTPKGVKVDGVGCPLDTDGDGVYDYLDKCPGTPKGVKVDEVGCPLDTDGDGVYDYQDKCPGTPKGVTVDEVGCPVKRCVEMKLDIKFDTDKSDVKSAYHDEIGKVADLLKKLEKSTAVIEGHTDSVASAAYNQKLSQRRADSVRKYLVDKFGIDAGRLTASGYGEERPAADNKTAAGKAQNRRVIVIFDCKE